MNPVRRKLALQITTIAAAVLAAAICSAAAPAGRYTVSAATGTVHDNKTGLTWQQTVSSQTYTTDTAGPYCASLGAGWRVPTIKELVTLIDFSVPPPGPTIDSTAFPDTPTSERYMSSTLLGASVAWNVDFKSGDICDNCGGSGPYLLRCVH